MASSPGPAEIRAGEGNNLLVWGSVDVLVLTLWWDVCLPGGASRELARSLLVEQMPVWQQRDTACPALMLVTATVACHCIKPECSGRSQKGVTGLCRRPDLPGPGCSGLCFAFALAPCGRCIRLCQQRCSLSARLKSWGLPQPGDRS